MNQEVIACIGAGNMGGCLLGGLIANGYPAKKLWATSPEVSQLTLLKDKLDICTSTNNQQAVEAADIIILAVKPSVMKEICFEISNFVQKKKPLIISIAAGIRETSIGEWLGNNIAIVRCMPNTPALIRCGATGLYANQFVTTNQKENAVRIMQAVGTTAWLEKENELDIVTALSGSGPAYFFLLIELMQDAAVKLGLSKSIAEQLVLQTALGATRLAQESQIEVKELRRRVTSPGGTTEAAINYLEKAKLQDLIFEAINAATKRAEELGND